MTDAERQEFDRELAELKQRVAQLEGRPFATWTPAERAASRENAARVKRLMQILINDASGAGSAG